MKNTKNNGISESWLDRILRSDFHTKYRHKSYFHSNQKSERLELVRWFSRKLENDDEFLENSNDWIMSCLLGHLKPQEVRY